MPPDSIRATIAALAVLLVLTGPVAAQDATADPALAAAEQARKLAEAAASSPRFVPGTPYAGCTGEPSEADRVAPTVPAGFVPTPGMNGGPGWLVSSPRGWPGPTRPGDVAELSLGDRLAASSRLVYADVTAPDGSVSRAGAAVFGARGERLRYPTDFRTAVPLVSGTYTVVWRDTITDRFIACDGFVVE